MGMLTNFTINKGMVMYSEIFNRLSSPNKEINYKDHFEYWTFESIPETELKDAIWDLFSSSDNNYKPKSYETIQNYMSLEFAYQEKCMSLIPADVSEKAKGAFWYSFLEILNEDEMNRILLSKEFDEGGTFYVIAYVDSMIHRLRVEALNELVADK